MVEFIGLLEVAVKKGTNLAIRDMMSSDVYVALNLGKQVSVSLCDCLLTCIYRLFVDLKSYCS